MTSNKPYLLRALYEWIVENHLTPYIVVNTDDPEVQVPMQFAENGKIILNVAPGSVRNLVIGNDKLQFTARFGGLVKQVSAPTYTVLAIYARENGRGMVFEQETESGGPEPQPPAPPTPLKPKLTIVKK